MGMGWGLTPGAFRSPSPRLGRSASRRAGPRSPRSAATRLSRFTRRLREHPPSSYPGYSGPIEGLSRARLSRCFPDFSDFLGRLQPSNTTIQRTPNALRVEESSYPRGVLHFPKLLSHLFLLVQTFSYFFKHFHTCSCVCIFVHTCSYVVVRFHTLSYLFLLFPSRLLVLF